MEPKDYTTPQMFGDVKSQRKTHKNVGLEMPMYEARFKNSHIDTRPRMLRDKGNDWLLRDIGFELYEAQQEHFNSLRNGILSILGRKIR